jgi:hypothetical protein
VLHEMRNLDVSSSLDLADLEFSLISNFKCLLLTSEIDGEELLG